jgi:hypothetical protein
MKYSAHWGGELRFRYTTLSKNEELQDVDDSLNAINERIIEFFLLPAKYKLFDAPSFSFYLGAGAYYEFDKLNEKGFFNMPALENLGKERVNSYSNDFSMHVAGPLVEIGFDYRTVYFSTSISGGVVPIFFLTSSQKMSIEPLLPNYADFSQDTAGSPYFFIDFDLTVLKYINIGFHYNFVQLNYKSIDFDNNLAWYNPERKVDTQSIKIEGAVLVPIGNDMSARIGYGYMFDTIKLDSVSQNTNNQYVIFTVRKTGI